MKFGPARKVPKDINSTGLALYDLLFGVERYVLVQGHLLTRIRPQEIAHNKRGGQRKSEKQWLVFFKALTVST